MVMQWTVNPPPLWHDWFDPSILHQVLSLCIVNLVDGLVWNEEAVGSNPTMETKFYV